MDGIADIATTLTGLPWYAAFVIVLLTVLFTRGIDALLRLRRSNLEERQYDDGETKAGYQALVKILENRILKLEIDFHEVIGELKDTRAAHSKCEVEQERLRGQVNLLQEKVAALERHEKVQGQHVNVINERIKQLDPGADLPPPIEPIRQ